MWCMWNCSPKQVVKIEKESANISADVLRLQEQARVYIDSTNRNGMERGWHFIDPVTNEKWLKKWTTWLVKDVFSSWFRSVGMFAVKTGRTGTTKSFGRGVAGEVRPVILARICWLPIDEPISPYLTQVWGQGFFLPNPGVGFLPCGDFPQCVCCSREASSWKAGNCPGQELQDTLQGERQKLLDAHEKMKTFQQEAWMVCCRSTVGLKPNDEDSSSGGFFDAEKTEFPPPETFWQWFRRQVISNRSHTCRCIWLYIYYIIIYV